MDWSDKDLYEEWERVHIELPELDDGKQSFDFGDWGSVWGALDPDTFEQLKLYEENFNFSKTLEFQRFDPLAPVELLTSEDNIDTKLFQDYYLPELIELKKLMIKKQKAFCLPEGSVTLAYKTVMESPDGVEPSLSDNVGEILNLDSRNKNTMYGEVQNFIVTLALSLTIGIDFKYLQELFDDNQVFSSLLRDFESNIIKIKDVTTNTLLTFLARLNESFNYLFKAVKVSAAMALSLDDCKTPCEHKLNTEQKKVFTRNFLQHTKRHGITTHVIASQGSGVVYNMVLEIKHRTQLDSVKDLLRQFLCESSMFSPSDGFTLIHGIEKETKLLVVDRGYNNIKFLALCCLAMFKALGTLAANYGNVVV